MVNSISDPRFCSGHPNHLNTKRMLRVLMFVPALVRSSRVLVLSPGFIFQRISIIFFILLYHFVRRAPIASGGGHLPGAAFSVASLPSQDIRWVPRDTDQIIAR